MDRRIRRLRQSLIGGSGKKHVGCLAADLELVEIVVLKDLDVIQPAFDHRVGARLAIFLQQVLLKRSRVHTDPDRAAVILGRLDHLADPLLGTDIAGIDAKTGRACLGGFDGAFVVEMDIRHDRNRAFAHDLAQRSGRVLVGRRDPNDIGPRLRRRQNLRDRGLNVGRVGIGHRLHADRRIAPNGNRTDVNLAGRAAVDVPPGAYMVQGHERATFVDFPP